MLLPTKLCGFTFSLARNPKECGLICALHLPHTNPSVELYHSAGTNTLHANAIVDRISAAQQSSGELLLHERADILSAGRESGGKKKKTSAIKLYFHQRHSHFYTMATGVQPLLHGNSTYQSARQSRRRRYLPAILAQLIHQHPSFKVEQCLRACAEIDRVNFSLIIIH